MPTLSVAVDFQNLIQAPEFVDLPLATEIRDSPSILLRIMGLAFHQLIGEVLNVALSQASGSTSATNVIAPFVVVRLQNYEPITSLKILKANYIGKFISVKGTIVRVGHVKPLVTRMGFKCSRCATSIVRAFPDGKFFAPTKCSTEGCRSKTFLPDRSSEDTKTVDFQTIRIQEIMEAESRESGRVPRTVECELTGDLVDLVVPGDIVVVNGEVKVVSTDDGPKGKKSKERAMFLLYLFANSVVGPRTKKNTADSEHDNAKASAVNEVLALTLKDLYAIRMIQEERDIFSTLVNSLCPTIYGHELVKAGLLLGLFGGRQKFVNDVNRIPVRGDPHILVVGDPGLGKSQMLKSVVGIAPRGVYVCGNTTTTAGLTVALHKDGPGGDYALEAGALVLGDQGCCCIDEFDKMGSQHTALLEAMEQQSISIAKAGMVCSLPARTSIIAAANPVGGHYNRARTVSENLKMNGALLSRFDLVFILLDQADEKMDRLLSAHVMAIHGSNRNRAKASNGRLGRMREVRGESAFHGVDHPPLADRALEERLQLQPGSDFQPIPSDILSKYVSYARTYVQPHLNSEAAAILQNFYIDLRQNNRSPDSTPITTRQIESLVRLAEARARLELREEVTASDAQDVVELMKCSMMDTYGDDLGCIDFDRSQHGSGMSKKAQAKKFISVLTRKAAESYCSIFSLNDLRGYHRKLGLTSSFLEFIDSLNNQGFLLKKGGRSYQLMTSDY